VKVVGARRLRATMKRAGTDLTQMSDAHQKVGQIVISAAAPRTPRQTGRLAGSLRASRTRASAVVRSSVVYAGVQEFGWPAHGIEERAFVRGGAKASEPVWLAEYLRAVDRALKKVKGA
jgi:phage gpG-like protein